MDFPVLNSGEQDLTSFLIDGPLHSKILAGSLVTTQEQYTVVIFIEATAEGVGQTAQPRSPWVAVTHSPHDFHGLWLSADEHHASAVVEDGFLIVHPPSGILVAGRRAAMVRKLEAISQHTILPRDSQIPIGPPNLQKQGYAFGASFSINHKTHKSLRGSLYVLMRRPRSQWK